MLAIKNLEKVLNLLRQVCILRREYVDSAVNVLTNSPNILGLTKADFFQLNSSQAHGKIG